MIATGGELHSLDPLKHKDFTPIERDLLLCGTESPQFHRHFPNSKPPATSVQGRFEGVVTNLQNLTVQIPLGLLVVVTGVSGAGKSSLIFDILDLSARHFAFNVPGGRCERCAGAGTLTIQMHFLPEIEVRCPACHGRRFKRETLAVQYRGYDISQVLDMTVEETLALFADVPAAAARLQVMSDVGLGYLQLGQPATTLSGGEAQRVKLARELGRRATGRTLYLLDEPTTGLHPADTARLLLVLQRLVDAGNSVIVVEHNLDQVSSKIITARSSLPRQLAQAAARN